MARKLFAYLIKKIRTASKAQFKYKLIENVQLFFKTMRCKAYLFDISNNNSSNNKQNKNENARNLCPKITGMKKFEKDLKKIQKMHNKFQKQLRKDLKRNASFNKAFFVTDKVQN